MHGKYSEGAGAQIQLYFAGRIPALENPVAFDTLQINVSLKNVYEGVSFEQVVFQFHKTFYDTGKHHHHWR